DQRQATVASQPAHGLSRDRTAPLEIGGRRSESSGQGLQPGGQSQVRLLAADLRQLAGIQLSPAELYQGVGPALASAALVVRQRLAQSVERRGETGAADRVEQAV